MTYTPWTAEDDARLRSLRQSCSCVKEIVPHFPTRSPGAVGCRLSLFGIPYPRRNASSWPRDLENRLRHLWNAEGKSALECAKILGVSRNAVIGKAHRMKLTERASPIKRRNVIEIDFGGCEWMDGEPREHRYCGKTRQRGSSYCPDHHARAWVKPPPRNKDKPNPFATIGDRALGKVRVI